MVKSSQISTIIAVVLMAIVCGKPTLDEENRNLCEDEPDLAECMREVEKVKSTPMALPTEEEKSANKNTNEGDEDSLMSQYEMIKKVRERSEKERKFWADELSNMNQWHKYGL